MIRIDGQSLTTAQIATAATGPLSVEVTGPALDRVLRSHEQAVLAGRLRPIYGLSTGVGANRTVDVEPDTAGAQGLLRSHATSAGGARSADRVRAMLLIRLNQLCAGGAGLRPVVVTALADMINADALPVIRETYVSEPNHTELEPFLGDGTPGASGVMVVEYVAAAALGDLRASAAPASTQSITLSRGIGHRQLRLAGGSATAQRRRAV